MAFVEVSKMPVIFPGWL